MRSILLALLFLLPLLHAAEARCWRLGGAAQPRSLRHGAFLLLLSTAEHEDGRLKLRVGLQNQTLTAVTVPPVMEASQIHLHKGSGGGNVACVDPGLGWREQAAALLMPQECVFTVLSFPWPEEDLDEITVLDVETHSPLRFLLNDSMVFTPPDLTRVEGRTMDLGAALEPLNEGNQNVGLRLGQMRCVDGALMLELIFKNIARYPIQLERCPKGGEARLLGSDGQKLAVLDVRGGIVDRIAPPGVWPPGVENRGILRFAMPQAHAASRLWFWFPGYPNLPLLFDEKEDLWKVDHANKQTPTFTAARLHSLAEQKLFDQVTNFWVGVSKSITEGRLDEARKHLEVEKEPELFQNLDRMAFESVDIQPFADQGLDLENGELRVVSLRMNYRLKGHRGTNAFYIPMYARMQVTGEGGWKIKALTFPHGPPFWSRGYHRVHASNRILVVHKDTPQDARHAQVMSGQLEAAYDHLLAAGLPMSATYVAFHCSDEGDFQILSGADPGMAAGAAPGVTIAEKGKLMTYNLAMYANNAGVKGHQAFADRGNQQKVTMEHELTHLALGEWSRPWTPGWLVEGAAVYFSSERFTERPDLLKDAMARGTSLAELTRHGTLRRENDEPLTLHCRYMLSAYAVGWIAKVFGEKRLLELYRAFSEEFPAEWKRDDGHLNYDDEHGPAKQEARARLTRLLLQKHLGADLAAIEQQILTMIRR
ncbi:MAG: hypothetical protein ACK5TH_02795 [Prosthecobacter sp.]